MKFFSLANLQRHQLDRAKLLMVVLLVLFQAITVITILVFSRFSTEAVLIKQAQTILTNATLEARRHTQAYMNSAARAVMSGSDMYSGDTLTEEDVSRTEKYFISALAHNPEFAGMYIGTTAGDFIYVSREFERSAFPYRIKHVDHEKGARATRTWWRNGSDRRLDITENPDDTYDPRTRPWFAGALEQDGLTWTRPYLFYTAQRPGITASAPIRATSGKVVGVLGVDLELEALAGFLAALNISETGSTFIADHNGVLIAAPQVGPTTQPSYLELIDSMNHPILKKALDAIIRPTAEGVLEQKTMFSVGGDDFISTFEPLLLAGGTKWFVGAYAPEKDFLGAIRRNERNNIVLAGGVLLLSMFIGWFIANSAWTPVETLHQQANRDQLTRAFNRHYLTRFADRIFERASRSKETISVAILDIDHFKPINDKYGHTVGDEVIRAFAGRLKAGSRSEDIIARFGGEEFVIVLPDTDAGTAELVLARIRDALKANPIATISGPVRVTFSAGICEASTQLDTYEKVLQSADTALYDAKHSGRDKTVLASQAKVTPSNVIPLDRSG